MTVTIKFALASPTSHPRPPLSQELKSTQLHSATIHAIGSGDLLAAALHHLIKLQILQDVRFNSPRKMAPPMLRVIPQA